MRNLMWIAVGVFAFVLWRATSVWRGASRRDRVLRRRLRALEGKLTQGRPVGFSEVKDLADAAENRPLLYVMLQHFERAELFPSDYLSIREQGKSALAYWLMHPSEGAAAPESIHFLEGLKRTLDGREADFLIYRYQMPEGHWADRDWLLGVVGPIMGDELPFQVAAFARIRDKYGVADHDELVDGFMKLQGLPVS